MNFKGCASCGRQDWAKAVRVRREKTCDEDGEFEETVTFDHVCKNCSHVICEHYYEFSVDSKGQHTLMECPLCGRGSSFSPHLTDAEAQDAVSTAGGGETLDSDETKRVSDAKCPAVASEEEKKKETASSSELKVPQGSAVPVNTLSDLRNSIAAASINAPDDEDGDDWDDDD